MYRCTEYLEPTFAFHCIRKKFLMNSTLTYKVSSVLNCERLFGFLYQDFINLNYIGTCHTINITRKKKITQYRTGKNLNRFTFVNYPVQ